MPQSKLRHTIYVSVKRKHPDWSSSQVTEEVSRIEGSQKVHKAKENKRKGNSPLGSQGSQVNHSKGSNTSAMEHFGILYRKNKDDFTLVYVLGDKIRPLRSLKTGMENSIPELSGLRILRDKGGNKKEEKK